MHCRGLFILIFHMEHCYGVQLWCPQSSLTTPCVSDAHTDTWTDDRHYQVPIGYTGGQDICFMTFN